MPGSKGGGHREPVQPYKGDRDRKDHDDGRRDPDGKPPPQERYRDEQVPPKQQ
jgi:hypothetical protein